MAVLIGSSIFIGLERRGPGLAVLGQKGTPIGPDHLMIAATAPAHGYEVLTDNPRESDRPAGLIVRRPAWPA